MVDDRPGKAEEHEEAEKRAEDVLRRGEGVGPARRSHQPPREKRHAEIIRRACDAMKDRHHHRYERAKNGEMWRKGTCYRKAGLGHAQKLLQGQDRSRVLADNTTKVQTALHEPDSLFPLPC